ncbi:MAG: SBBP repeat-containing protein, partial [Chloroflexi bacterium]|nr:SBBP repeat-containing protein [Chloroflexota bacterium]
MKFFVSKTRSVAPALMIVVMLLVAMLSAFYPSAVAIAEEPPETQWVRQFGSLDSQNEMVQAVDAKGSAYVAGYTTGTFAGQSSAGAYDAFVHKYDSGGNQLWIRQFGTPSYDYASGITVDDTGVYVVGETYGTFPGQASAGEGDAFVRKYDLSGNEIWTRQFGTARGEI